MKDAIGFEQKSNRTFSTSLTDSPVQEIDNVNTFWKE